jgi:hypothetical protein
MGGDDLIPTRIRRGGNSTEDKCREKFGYYPGGYGHGEEYGSSRRDWVRENDLEQSCKTRNSNARGKYTSLVECRFTFHAIPDDHPRTNYLSSACSDDNAVEEHPDAKHDPVMNLVNRWPDACVGDFARCYSVSRDEAILLPHLCAGVLKLPPGTTHVSVDCTDDKARQKKMKASGELDRQNDPAADPYLRHQRRAQLEFYAFVAALALAACLCGCLCLALVNRYAVRPYLKALKRTRSDPELAGLTSSPDSSRS